MAEKSKVLLDNVIKEEIKRISSLPADEKTKAIDGVTKLYKIKIDEMEADQKAYDAYDRKAEADREYELKERQLVESRKDRWIKIGLDVLGIVVPIVFYGVWMEKGFRFEETGSITSGTFKGLINKFKPTK